MSDWNFDIDAAPKGQARTVKRIVGKKEVDVEYYDAPTIIAAGSGGVVTTSRWLPNEGRWNMFTKAVPPVAWMPWPDHPCAPTGPVRTPAKEVVG